MKAAGLRGWRFDHGLGTQTCLRPHHYDGGTVEAAIVDLGLTGGFDAYLASRNGSVRREAGRTRRALERDAGELALEWHSVDVRDLERLVAWKSRRYEGAREIFAQADASEILERTIASRVPGYSGALSVLRAGETRVAVQLNVGAGASISAWLSGYDEVFARYGPGIMIILAILKEAAAHGVTRVDLGYGQHDYKQKLANARYPVSGGAVWASPLEATARAVVCRAGSRWGPVSFALRSLGAAETSASASDDG